MVPKVWNLLSMSSHFHHGCIMKMGLKYGFNSSLIRPHWTERGLAWIPRIKGSWVRERSCQRWQGRRARVCNTCGKEDQRSPHTHTLNQASITGRYRRIQNFGAKTMKSGDIDPEEPVCFFIYLCHSILNFVLIGTHGTQICPLWALYLYPLICVFSFVELPSLMIPKDTLKFVYWLIRQNPKPVFFLNLQFLSWSVSMKTTHSSLAFNLS